jgi:hypothetical protein
MYEVVGLHKRSLQWESFSAANIAEARRIQQQEACEFYSLSIRRVRAGR